MIDKSSLFHNLPYRGNQDNQVYVANQGGDLNMMRTGGRTASGKIQNKWQPTSQTYYASTQRDDESLDNYNYLNQREKELAHQHNEPIFNAPSYQDIHAPFAGYQVEQPRPQQNHNYQPSQLFTPQQIQSGNSNRLSSAPPSNQQNFSSLPVSNFHHLDLEKNYPEQYEHTVPKRNPIYPEQRRPLQSSDFLLQKYNNDLNKVERSPVVSPGNIRAQQENSIQSSIIQELVLKKDMEHEIELQSLKQDYQSELNKMLENQEYLTQQLDLEREERKSQQQEFQMRFTQLSQQFEQQASIQNSSIMSQNNKQRKSTTQPYLMQEIKQSNSVLQPPIFQDLSLPHNIQQNTINSPNQNQYRSAKPQQLFRDVPDRKIIQPQIIDHAKLSESRVELNRKFQKPTIKPQFNQKQQPMRKSSQTIQSIYKTDRLPSENRASIFGQKELIKNQSQELFQPQKERDTTRISTNFQRVSAQFQEQESQFMKYLAANYPIDKNYLIHNPNKSEHLVSQDERDLLSYEYTFCMLCSQFLTLDKAEQHVKKCSTKDLNHRHVDRDLDLVKLFSTCYYPEIQRNIQLPLENQIVGLNEELQKIKYLGGLELRRHKDFSMIQQQVRELSQYCLSILQFTIDNNKSFDRAARMIEDFKQLFQIMDHRDLLNHKQFMFILQKGCVISEKKLELLKIF